MADARRPDGNCHEMMYDDENEENGPLLGDLIDVEDTSKDKIRNTPFSADSKDRILSEEWQDPLLDVASPKHVPNSSQGCDVNPKDHAVERQCVRTIGRKSEDEEQTAVLRDPFWWYLFLSSIVFNVSATLYSLCYADLSVLERRQDQAGFVGDGFLQISRLKRTIFVDVPLLSVAIGFVSVSFSHIHPKIAIHLGIYGSSMLSVVTAGLIFSTQVGYPLFENCK
jgi:hypothetical protein